MSYWKCIKTLIMEDDLERGPYRAFTEGRVYLGQSAATPGGEWAIAFTNDMGDENHLMTSKWLHEYFKIEEEEEIQKAALGLITSLLEGNCPHCGARVAQEEKIGRSVYARPCGHRLYQGKPGAFRKKGTNQDD